MIWRPFYDVPEFPDRPGTAMVLIIDADGPRLAPGPVMWDCLTQEWVSESSGKAIELSGTSAGWWADEDDLIAQAMREIAGAAP